MLSLKSKKISLGVLVALVSIDWYVGLQTPDSGSSNPADSAHMGVLPQHLPTLRIAPISPAFASGRLFNFSDSGNSASPYRGLQTLAFTTPLQIGLTQLSRHESAQQFMDTAQENLSDQTIREMATLPPTVDTESTESTVDVRPAMPPVQARAKADTPQAVNLLKLLALYSMLHR